MQARHISYTSRAIMAFARGRLSPSHEIMAANDWKTPGGGSLQISLGRRGKFPLPVLFLLFSLEGVRRRGALSRVMLFCVPFFPG